MGDDMISTSLQSLLDRKMPTGQKHENDYDFDEDWNEIVIPIPCNPEIYARLLTADNL